MERYYRLILVLLAVAVAMPVVVKSRRSPNILAPAVFSVASSVRGYVRISGDVRYPGMYPCSVNMLTNDVMIMAVPLRQVKMLEPAGSGAVPLSNGDSLQVLVRSGGTALVARSLIPAAERLVMGIPLDINSMSEAELDKVPGIGPALARRIVLYRQNNGDSMSVQDLLSVEGVGEKKFYYLRNYF
jgi:competence protein ComEA